MYLARSGSPGSRTASAYWPGSARTWIGMASDSSPSSARMPLVLTEPSFDQVLEFCGRSPVERVFLEDVARRRLGRFVGAVDSGGVVGALCHVGANLVPSGDGCGVFAEAAGRSRSRMVIGEERAVGELWSAAAAMLPRPREDRPGQPVYVLDEPPPPGNTALRPAR